MTTEKYMLFTIFLMIIPGIALLTIGYLPKRMQNWLESSKWGYLLIVIIFVVVLAGSCYEF